jgi:hypothetical protein
MRKLPVLIAALAILFVFIGLSSSIASASCTGVCPGMADDNSTLQQQYNNAVRGGINPDGTVGCDVCPGPAAAPQTVQPKPNSQGGPHEAPNGMVVPKNTLGVYEVVDFNDKKIHITAPYFIEAFYVGNQSGNNVNIHRAAWLGYDTEADAISGACSQVAERVSQTQNADWAKGMQVHTYGFSCGDQSQAGSAPQATNTPAPPPAPSQPAVNASCGGIVKAFRVGQTVPGGCWYVREIVDYSAEQIRVDAVYLNMDTKMSVINGVHWNYWGGFASPLTAQRDAYNQAAERLESAKTRDSWNYRYSIWLGGMQIVGDMPDDYPTTN